MMAGYYVIFGTLILFATAVGLWDLLAERQHRRQKHKKSV